MQCQGCGLDISTYNENCEIETSFTVRDEVEITVTCINCGAEHFVCIEPKEFHSMNYTSTFITGKAPCQNQTQTHKPRTCS